LELAPGHLFGLHRVADPQGPQGLFWRNESFDSGQTWTTPEPTAIRSGACPRPRKLRDGRLLLTDGRRKRGNTSSAKSRSPRPALAHP